MYRFLICGVLAICACGCLSPEDRFKQTGAQVYVEGDQFGGVVFGSLIDTSMLRGQQFMYKVRLMDERARPIKSHNRAYEDESGNVAAQKTLMVFSGHTGSERTEVRIPAHELELRSRDFPVWISYGLYYPDGSMFTEVFRPLPHNTQKVVQRFVTSTYGDEPRQTAPPKRAPRRRVRRPARPNSTSWRPEASPRGPGFCPRHGVACNCDLRKDVPPEYMRSQTRSAPGRPRASSGQPRPSRNSRPQQRR